MSSDDRAFLMQAALSMNLEASVLYLYPRLYPLVSLTPIAQKEGTPKHLVIVSSFR